MLEELLPAGVACEERFDDPPDALLLEGEAAAMGRGAARRRREHATGRHCARVAMARLGLPVAAVGRGSSGEPLWPGGVVGSITHCDGYRAAAVARRAVVVAIGIDAEPHQPLPEEVPGLVLVPEERAWIERLGRSRPETCWDRLVFSAKESVFKAWYPAAQRWLGFEDAEISVDAPSAVFRARLRVPAPQPLPEALTGRWLIRDGLVLTAVAVTVDPYVRAQGSRTPDLRRATPPVAGSRAAAPPFPSRTRCGGWGGCRPG
ncbi:MAG: 4-phosphopantetheinyl transferase [Chloroflexi bacterium]|jgi:4'-phosphopantetheinyl transferase EntD|nr:4-phosphopantetheinyl transferase [Chloroflexota bacterium]